jgi:hypothetical protein
MNDLAPMLQVGLLLGLYPFLVVGMCRLLLRISPWRREHPAQGTVTLAAVAALILDLMLVPVLFPGTLVERTLWIIYMGMLLSAMALVWISLTCVSESGRRFYLLHLIDTGMRSIRQLRACYGQKEMLTIRIERLLKWQVIVERDGRYYLRRYTAYLYARFFHLWGELLGFRWE